MTEGNPVTAIDELVRETLTADAETHHAAGDLAARSLASGRRLRRRRQAGLAAASLASVTAVVAGSLALSGAVGHDSGNAQLVSPAHHGGARHGHTQAHPNTATGQPWWQEWSTDRVYASKPATSFFDALAPGDSLTIYASGSMPDGTDFAMYTDPANSDPHVAEWTQGWNDVVDFGEAAPPAQPDAQFSYFESPTYDTGKLNQGTSQWLIVAGRPGTTAASYSADGTTWTDMDVQHGIAVLGIPRIAPQDTARIRLSDDTGQYVDGPLNGQ